MKKFCLFFFALAIGISGANAQTQQDAPAAKPEVQTETVDPSSTAKGIPKPKPAFKLANDLDGLFAQLKRTPDKRRAKRISDRIWIEWRTSDSRSIDLLTGWARQAMANQKYHRALDLLDQVVVIEPDYAEGWNQRATLHYQMDDYAKSVADIERTLALEPRHYGALAGLASIFTRLNQKERALETWYQVLEIYPAMQSAQTNVLRLEEELAGSGI